MILIAIVAVLALNSWCDAYCVSDYYVNGCSIPLGAPFPFKDLFAPVCNRHDICYFCGERYGWTRKECDEAFKRDMTKKCEEKHANRKRFFSSIVKAMKDGFRIAGKIIKWPYIKGDLEKCNQGAEIYFDSVNSFAASYYVDPSPYWCEHQCAKEAGDPKIERMQIANEIEG